MINRLQYILLGWFIIINAFIFVSSWIVLRDGLGEAKPASASVPEFPKMPPPLVLEPLNTSLDPKVQEQVIKADKQRTDAYTQQVEAYTQEVEAYKTYVGSAFKSEGNAGKETTALETYKVVIGECLSSLLNTLLVALAAYAFVAAGTRLLRAYRRAK